MLGADLICFQVRTDISVFVDSSFIKLFRHTPIPATLYLRAYVFVDMRAYMGVSMLVDILWQLVTVPSELMRTE